MKLHWKNKIKIVAVSRIRREAGLEVSSIH